MHLEGVSVDRNRADNMIFLPLTRFLSRLSHTFGLGFGAGGAGAQGRLGIRCSGGGVVHVHVDSAREILEKRTRAFTMGCREKRSRLNIDGPQGLEMERSLREEITFRFRSIAATRHVGLMA